MEDIATISGGTFITPEVGHKLEEVTMDMLGIAEKVIVSKDTTTIVNGGGEVDDIKKRVEQIKLQMDESTSDYDKEKLQERLAKLAGGVAVLYIGAGSEVELKEKKDRVDDALQATRAAIEEGIVEGGGIALLKCLPALDALMNSDNEDENDGVDVVASALKAPLVQILKNGGIESGVVLRDIKLNGGGYDARNEKYVDMFEAGIIDPKKVTRTAIQNAVSVVGMILTTDCMIVDKKEDKPNQPQIPMM
jgi:chaperonin GroEL